MQTKIIILRIYLLISLFLISIKTKGQNVASFKADFRKFLTSQFSERELSKFIADYPSIIFSFDGQEANPIEGFKREKLYKDNIIKLFNSVDSNQRLLAYLVIGATRDSSFEPLLLDRIKSEKREGNLIWAGTTLLALKTTHTTEIFDFLVKNEDFGDAHMLPFYIRLNKDSLQKTAYLRINSGEDKAKVLAAQTLSVTGLNPRTEKLLRSAVEHWNINIKGYAVYSIKVLKVGNLLPLLTPFIDSPQVKSIEFEALASSPTESDRKYVYDTIDRQDSVSHELMNCLLNSNNEGSIKLWLKLLYSKQIEANYYFSIYDQKLIFSDLVLNEVQTALEKIKDKSILDELIAVIKDRSDIKSLKLKERIRQMN